jgi:hypothetical protein
MLEQSLEKAKTVLIENAMEFNALAMDTLMEEPPNPQKLQALQQLSQIFSNAYSQMASIRQSYGAILVDPPTVEPTDSAIEK